MHIAVPRVVLRCDARASGVEGEVAPRLFSRRGGSAKAFLTSSMFPAALLTCSLALLTIPISSMLCAALPTGGPRTALRSRV